MHSYGLPLNDEIHFEKLINNYSLSPNGLWVGHEGEMNNFFENPTSWSKISKQNNFS